MTRVKVCGITNVDDALAACESGADAIGFVFADSVRRVTAAAAESITASLPPFVTTVGVFVDAAVEQVRAIAEACRLDLVQLHGREDREYVRQLGVRYVKSFRVTGDPDLAAIEAFGCRTFLLDTYSPLSPGGTGRTFDWSLAVKAKKLGRIILAGGLTVGNITRALSAVRPYAVDVSSGVERRPGRKDHRKIDQFIKEVRAWDYRTKEATSASSADDLFLKH